MKKINSMGIRVVLVLSGLFVIFTALNVAFGGMPTLGWQGSMAFFEVTNSHPYQVQDSHIRFIATVWLSVGLLFLIAPTNLERYRSALSFSFAAIFLGGIVRVSQINAEIFPDLAGSLGAELIGIPLLYFWISKTQVRTTSQET